MSAKLELLKSEVRQKTGKRVAKSHLVAQILSQFFEKDIPLI